MTPWQIGLHNLREIIPPGTPERYRAPVPDNPPTDTQRLNTLTKYLKLHHGPVDLIDCIRDCEMSPVQIKRVAKGSKRIEVKTVRKRTTLEWIR